MKQPIHLFALSVVFFTAAAVAQDHADPASRVAEPARVGDDNAALEHCLVAEADAHTADYAPILSVLANRAQRVGSTPAEVARRYCAALHVRRPTPRQALVLALPGGDGARAYARAWRAAVAAVEHFRGPTCPATHWGSVADGAPLRSVRVDCGHTLNVFYTERVGRPVPAVLARGRRGHRGE